jgi:nucleotide-binding universal stress UspA family protein
MYQRILVPVDGSATSGLALQSAISLARSSGGRIRLLHVVEELAYATGFDQFGGYSGALIDAMKQAGAAILKKDTETVTAAGVEVDNMLYDKFGERLGETVAEAARLWNADLIVVGTHGRRGLGRLLMGSGAEQVVRQAPTPVLVVRDTTAGAPA